MSQLLLRTFKSVSRMPSLELQVFSSIRLTKKSITTKYLALNSNFLHPNLAHKSKRRESYQKKMYPDKKITYNVDMAIQGPQTISEQNSFLE